MIKPIHPVERGKFHRLEMPPGSEAPNDFRFKEPDHRFRERVEAPMCQEWVSGRRRGSARVMVTEQRVVDLPCHKALETADDVLLA